MSDRAYLRRMVIAGGWALLVAWPGALAAQTPNVSSRIDPWGPALDSAGAALSSRGQWRGFVVGSTTATAFADFALYGYAVTAARNPTPWGMSARVSASGVRDSPPTAPAGSRLDASLAVSRRVGDADAFYELLATAYHSPHLADDSGFEFGVSVNRVHLPIFAEPDLILGGVALLDRGGLDGVYTAFDLAAELTPSPLTPRLELRLGISANANSYFDESFHFQSVATELSVQYHLLERNLRSLLLSTAFVVRRVRSDATLGSAAVGLMIR